VKTLNVNSIAMKLIKLFIYSNLALMGICSCSKPSFKFNSSRPSFNLNPERDAIAHSADPMQDEVLTSYIRSSGKAPVQVASKQKISSYYNVTKPYPLTAKLLNKTLKGKLLNKGQDIINVSNKYKICPLFLAAVCCHETGNGESIYAKKYNNVSGQMYRNKLTGKWGPMKFSSVTECLTRTASNLKENYIDEGRTSISKIQAKYCPVITNKKSKDYNDPSGINKHWTTGVQKWMTRIQS
jgi:hypothetical protein